MKNTVIVGLEDRQVKYLGATHEGKKHDKRLCEEEGIQLPPDSDLSRDSAYQGHDLPGVHVHQPKKKPRGGELSVLEKENNRLIAKVRIGVEQVIAGIKRCHIVTVVFRNTKAHYDDLVMELACGLHNFRSYCRLDAY